jgi:hypothetical protein
MIIHISTEELEEEFRTLWKAGLITSPAIDYATNAIHGWFEGKDRIIFRFKDYGFINDNRFNTYNLSVGSAGITVQIIKTRDNETKI